MLSDVIHAIHLAYSSLIDTVFPAGSAGPAVKGALNFPADLSINMETVIRGFGS